MAFVYLLTTIVSCKTRSTVARVVVNLLQAGSSIGTRFHNTHIDAILAQRSNKSRHALASELVYLIHTGATVQARVSKAVVHVDLTSLASESYGADALHAVVALSATALIFAWIRKAFGLVLAVGAAVSWPAEALVARICVGACTSIQARLVCTTFGWQLATRSGEASGTNTHAVGHIPTTSATI